MKQTLLTAVLAAGFATTAMAQDDFKWQPFYTQTYENVAQVADVWNCPNNQGGLSLKEKDGNHYVYYVGSGSGDRGMRNLDVMSAADYDGLSEYRLEFDLALGSKSQDAHLTEFHVASPDLSYNSKNINYGIGDGALLSLFQSFANGEDWQLYCQNANGNNDLIDAQYIVTLTSEKFYRFMITVSPAEDEALWDANVQVEIAEMDGTPVMISCDGEELSSVTLPYTDLGNGYWFYNFYPRPSRNGGSFMIDNIQVMKKVDAASVTPPTLSMTGVQMEGRIIALDNGAETELTPYYAIVDEAAYEAAETVEGLNGTQYTAPFIVSEATNYILAWNVNENGKASELTKFTCEAGWAVELQAPVIAAVDYNGYKKTYEATCWQGDVKPLAPIAYTIYMSTDSINWVESSTITVTSGLVYAKVEADGYLPAGSEPIEVPVECYASTMWSINGMVITKELYPDFNFDNSGKGRVHVPAAFWNEDLDAYDAESAWEPLKKMGLHFKGADSDMFLLGSGNANGFTITGLVVYNARANFSIDDLQAGDIVQVYYNDNTSEVLTVNDPETFVVSVPQHGKHAGLQSIAIKGMGTVETRDVAVGEWGILSTTRSVCTLEDCGATFYEHVYTIYNDETSAADTLLLKPVDNLLPGAAYIYKANADKIELVSLALEDEVDYQPDEQIELENGTFYSSVGDTYEEKWYTMYPGGILMKSKEEVELPLLSGGFQGLDDAENYNDVLDYKMQNEYLNYWTDTEKYITDYENKVEYEYVLDENGEKIWNEETNEWLQVEKEKEPLDYEKVYADRYAQLLSKYVVVPVIHEYNEEVATPVAAVNAPAVQLVNVVTPAGVVVRRGVKASEALNGLQRGLYIVGQKKVVK